MTPSPPHAPTAPALGQLAESIHRCELDHEHAATFISVSDGDDDLTIGLWPIPDGTAHPLLPLVGFRAPDRWWAAGVTLAGTGHDLAADGTAPAPIRATLVRHRHGEAASIIEHGHGPLQIVEEPPEGFGPDVIARTLGLPTPEPEHTMAAYVEATWLERLAAGRRDDGGDRSRSWRWLADRHPLRGDGLLPEPHELAARSVRYAADVPWAALRHRLRDVELPAASWGPTGGSVEPLGTWFDDGSLCRSILRQLPHAPTLLHQLVIDLPAKVADSLVEALVETRLDGGWA